MSTDDDLLSVLAAHEPRERADAARNRRVALAAADRLFAERGARNVSMDDVAAAAGVGKGTLYRRFNDRAGLALAVLEDKERELQDAVIRGAPPLGPGAPAAERLRAFLHALLDLLDAHTDLHVLSETSSPGARYRSGLYAFYRLHVELLLRELVPRRDPAVLADQLLAPLAVDLFVHLRDERRVEVERIRAGLTTLVDAVVAAGAASG
ncbi:MAG TPA: helix-turn-helix domain-containing protein [Actinomycetota bacterium]|nr:helix-turn-helix domain-containing protein [Actinomycetota bacterium]